MIFNFSGADSNYPESICSLKGIKITNTKTFKYLGCKIDYNYSEIGHSEINNRINSGNAAFQQHKNLLRNFHINLKTRIIFLNACVRSRLTVLMVASVGVQQKILTVWQSGQVLSFDAAEDD